MFAWLTAPHSVRFNRSRRSCRGCLKSRQMTQGKPLPEARAIVQGVASDVTKVQEVGGLVGRTLLAVLAVYVVSRRKLIRVFQIPGLIVMPIVFGYVATRDLQWLYVGMFFAGLFTVGQFSFWGNYLPQGLSGSPARHRRELCREYRWTSHRDVIRLVDGNARRDERSRERPGQGCAGRRVRGVLGVSRRTYCQLLPARAAARRPALTESLRNRLGVASLCCALLTAVHDGTAQQPASGAASRPTLRERLQAKFEELHKAATFPGGTAGFVLADGSSFAHRRRRFRPDGEDADEDHRPAAAR